MSDDRLGVYVIASSRWRLITDALKARLGGVHVPPNIERFSGAELIVDSSKRRLQIALDGEPTDLERPLTFRSRPGALRVLAAT